MKKWEYRLFSWDIIHSYETIEHYLNTAGSEGWEAVGAGFNQDKFFTLMKREKKGSEPKEPQTLGDMRDKTYG